MNEQQSRSYQVDLKFVVDKYTVVSMEARCQNEIRNEQALKTPSVYMCM